MNGIAFTVALLLFIGGMVLFGYALEVKGFEAIMFTGGIAAVALAMAIPFHFLKRAN
jgi:hypothetical protein